MKNSHLFLLVIATIFSQMAASQEFIPDLDPRYWEDPDYERHYEDDVTILNKIGTWTYYKVNDSLGRINLIERNITCIDCNTIYEQCGDKVTAYTPSSCDLTYELDDAECENLISPFWVDPLGSVYYERDLDNVQLDGMWYLFMSERCPIAIDSIVVENCEIPLDDDICNDININSSGDGDWSASYISSGNGNITFIFGTRSVPDRLTISINGSVIDDSGNYSSNTCDDTYGTCIGTVNYGCGNHYIVDIPLSYNDVLNVDVYGNTCNLSGTEWELSTLCNSNYTDNTPLLDRARHNDGTDDDNVTSIHYYPNPVSYELSIKSFGEITPNMVQVIDNTGRIIREIYITDFIMIVNTNDLTPGIYMFKAIYDTYTDTQLVAVSK